MAARCRCPAIIAVALGATKLTDLGLGLHGPVMAFGPFSPTVPAGAGPPGPAG